METINFVIFLFVHFRRISSDHLTLSIAVVLNTTFKCSVHFRRILSDLFHLLSRHGIYLLPAENMRLINKAKHPERNNIAYCAFDIIFYYEALSLWHRGYLCLSFFSTSYFKDIFFYLKIGYF